MGFKEINVQNSIVQQIVCIEKQYRETFKEFLKSGHFTYDMGKLNSCLMDLKKQVMIGSSLKLGTPQERVKLLKAGADGKLIGKLYVELNNFKIVSGHVLFNLTNDINIKKKVV